MSMLAACGGGGAGAPAPTVTAERDVPFSVVSITARSNPAGARVDALREGGTLRITVYMGEQRTGGYTIAVERVTLAGDELRVHARFTSPAPDAFVTQVITSPAQTITVGAGARTVVLLDQQGAERARSAVP